MAYNAAIHMDWGLFFEFEVPLAPLLPLLPPGIAAVGNDAEKAVLTLNLAHFVQGGDQIDLPENHEIDFGVLVPVDNTNYQGMPQADAAAHMLNIASDSKGYLEVCKDSGYCIHDRPNLTFEFDQNGLNGRVWDDDGPIVSIKTVKGEALKYGPFRRVGQDVVYDHREEYRLNFVFEGKGLIDPSPNLFEIVLESHPFFRGLALSGRQICQSQFALSFGEKATLSFFGANED
ncbi:MAG: hypothetical protein HOA08_03640 [Rhodospirillaceae bacterium]|jgi:hypothetical protein|nr:hypothetical protein [Rhodospirillaceae bacterium]MBT3781754.1 hypothetical protein [Rhodospirillaceae bacterium]MBT4562026.1 hypothetical protein [Rhodospirillaceae bacterium]MBT4745447.1 hypothetical protein [Rhodospirillaceae bacterium]MBT5131244.1 hypothetical protein [Rhodospirillaceae bacterium]